jgi:hypothetical protein
VQDDHAADVSDRQHGLSAADVRERQQELSAADVSDRQHGLSAAADHDDHDVDASTAAGGARTRAVAGDDPDGAGTR